MTNNNLSEAKSKWGNTAAFKEFEQRFAGKSEQDKDATADGLMNLFKEFGQMMDKSHTDAEVQNQVQKLKQYITDNYYTCTSEILAGLGQMYVSDARFTENIDKVGGSGCAKFVSEAIKAYIERS